MSAALTARSSPSCLTVIPVAILNIRFNGFLYYSNGFSDRCSCIVVCMQQNINVYHTTAYISFCTCCSIHTPYYTIKVYCLVTAYSSNCDSQSPYSTKFPKLSDSYMYTKYACHVLSLP